jgi:hypothetical protein
VPLTVNEVGLLFVPFQLAMKPKLLDPAGAIVPFQLRLVAVTVAPDVAWVALQIWLICCPLANVQTTFHPLIAAVPVLVMDTSPWKPPDHELVIVYVTRQVPVDAVGLVLLLGLVLADAEADAEVDGEVDGEFDADELGLVLGVDVLIRSPYWMPRPLVPT